MTQFIVLTIVGLIAGGLSGAVGFGGKVGKVADSE